MTPEVLLKFMTYQIGLKATDGWVLASDTAACDECDVFGGGGVGAVKTLLTTSASKIVRRDDFEMVYAFSGGALARCAGFALEKAVKQGLAPSERAHYLTGAFFEARKEYPNYKEDGELIVIFGYGEDAEMWTVTCGKPAVLRTEVAYGGGGNLAVFYPQRFYSLTSAEKLTFLAAHTILEAHTFNPTVVRGLEIYQATHGTVEPLSPDTLAKLTKRSVKLGKHFNRLIL